MKGHGSTQNPVPSTRYGSGAAPIRRRFGPARWVLDPGSWVLLVIFAVLASAPTPASAQQPTDREIAESQRRLEQIRKERAQLRAEMGRIRSRVSNLSGELRNLRRQVGTSAELVEELDSQVVMQEAEIEANTRELLGTQDLLAERRAILNRRLRDIYKRGPLQTAQVLLTAESFSDLLNRYKYLFLVARRDRSLVGEVSGLEVQLVARERALRGSLFEMERMLEEKAAEHAQLEGLERDQRRALSGLQARERTTSTRIERLARDEKQLSTLIATLERKRKEAERLAAERRASGRAASPAEKAALTTSDLGRLGWPADGRVLYRFGRTTQPNGTVIRRNGIGIGASAGSQVKAVEEGTVVMAGPFEGYGPTVIVSHGGGYYSLYLYLKEVSVREGDAVSRAQVVGTVGGERTPEGTHLEFQIRAPGGQAVDPLAWLQSRRPS